MWWVLLGCVPTEIGEPVSGHTGRVDETALPTASGPEWTSRPVVDLVTARILHVTSPSAVPSTARCVADTDPLEEHVVHHDPAVDADLSFVGLLGGTAYTCEVTAGEAEDTVAFVTDPLPSDLPTVSVTGRAWGSYLLLNHSPDRDGVGQRVLVLDPEGRVRWYRSVVGGTPDLDTSLVDGRILYGGGYGVAPTRVDLLGRVQSEAAPGSWNHHVGELSTGDVLGEVKSTNTDGVKSWTGFEIVELDPGLQQQVLTWDSQSGVNDGFLPVPTVVPGDPYHANAFAELPDGDVLVSLYAAHRILRLDLRTGELVWALGRGLDFQLLEADGTPASDDRWFTETHAPEIHGNRLLVYDNGKSRPGGPQTRVLELELDEAARTARITWEWTRPGWYEPIWGDVDRLPNGDVNVTAAHCEPCGGSGPTTEVLEVDPATDEVVWQLTFGSPSDAGYRSEQLDGCAIFANRRYCPTL